LSRTSGASAAFISIPVIKQFKTRFVLISFNGSFLSSLYMASCFRARPCFRAPSVAVFEETHEAHIAIKLQQQ
ncbi:hypothetical protein CISIN_1g0457891mg, partial [Citrus sinensis]